MAGPHEQTGKLERIVVDLEDRDGNHMQKAFNGRWLVTDFETDDTSRLAGERYFAVGDGGDWLALWVGREVLAAEKRNFCTYESFEDAAEDGWPGDFLSAVASAMGREYAEEINS